MTKNKFRFVAVAAVAAIVGGYTVQMTAGAQDKPETTPPADLHFHVITHGDDGVFWSVVQTAVEQAAADLGVEVSYFGANERRRGPVPGHRSRHRRGLERDRHLARRP